MTIAGQENAAQVQTDPLSGSVPAMLAWQAAKRPEALAVADGVRSLTYRELDESANRLSRYLRSRGIGKDSLVGVCLPRGVELAIAALGIWKAGGAYLPMDPDYPPSRLAFILNDAQAPVLISTAEIAGRLPASGAERVFAGTAEIERQLSEPLALETGMRDLAYAIYTSGSTGNPKGVEIEQAGLANLVAWHVEAFGVTAEDRASHVAGLGFDAAVWELWPYLATGASVHFASDLTRSSAELLRDWMVERGITIGFVPTPLAERIVGLEWPGRTRLRIMLTGGDTLHRHPPAGLPFALVNNYGPTECSVVATSGTVEPVSNAGAMPSIGRAIARTSVYILDENLGRVPPDTPGEMYIGGAGVARGYRNLPDLTRERFLPDPFAAGGRMYRSGDLGRMLPDGQIAFLGRADDQIKIRGYRIEPGEIANKLNAHPDVLQSLVAAAEDHEGGKRLIGYVALKPGSSATHTALRDFLRADLPEYMLPSVFVRVNELPMTPHGKVDRAALPDPSSENTLADDVALRPRSALERRLAEVITPLLGLKEIGASDNFFMLGGHSLLGAQLIARLRDTFGVEIPLRSLFETPTIEGLAARIEHLG